MPKTPTRSSRPTSRSSPWRSPPPSPCWCGRSSRPKTSLKPVGPCASGCRPLRLMFTAIMVSTLVFLLVGARPTKIRFGQDDPNPSSPPSPGSPCLRRGPGHRSDFLRPNGATDPLPQPTVRGCAGAMTLCSDRPPQSSTRQSCRGWCMRWWWLGLRSSPPPAADLPLFEPLITDPNNRVAGKIIDIFAVLVTSSALRPSLLGALQIRTGTRSSPASSWRATA